MISSTTKEKRIYFGRTHGNSPAMHESEDKSDLDEVLAVFTRAGLLEILAGTTAEDITVIVNSAQDHTEINLKVQGFQKVAIID